MARYKDRDGNYPRTHYSLHASSIEMLSIPHKVKVQLPLGVCPRLSLETSLTLGREYEGEEAHGCCY